MIKKKIKPNIYNISLSTIGHFIVDLYPAFIVGIIPLVADKYDLSIFQVSAMTAISQISNSITQPLFGYLSDKHGLKHYMTYGILVAAFFLSLIAIISNYFVILVLLFIGNLGVAAFHPPSAAIGAEYKGKKKGLGNSIISLGGSVGYSIGSLFFISIIDKIGMKFSPLAMIPGIIIAILLLKKIPADNKKRSIYKNDKNISLKSRFSKFKFHKLKLIHFFLVWTAAFSRDVLWVGLVTFMPLYLTSLKVNIINISIILLVFGIMGGMGGIFFSYFADKIKRNILIQIAYIAIIPLTYCIFKTNGLLSIILFIFIGFFLISSVPLCISMSHDIFPKNLSLASSLIMGLSAGFAGIAVMLLGKLADRIGIEKTIYIILILPFIAVLSMFFIPYMERNDI
ncbi:MAG: MFS transporter [Actinomycetota bacterium]|nr:MFS transporter [Actinomycetota bacterium]